MSARASILGKIRGLNLQKVSLPELPEPAPVIDTQQQLVASLERNLCTVVRSSENNLREVIHGLYPEAREIFSTIAGINGSVAWDLSSGPGALSTLDLTVVRAEFAVAENGALWIRQEDLEVPAACFMPSNLVVVLEEQEVVPDMHAAYRRLTFNGPFGVFIAGPSRTADIEQSLVIGAHGPLTMAVVLVN
ncbi:MAG: lactate utilization protein C [Bacteroidota bacterium]